MDNRMNAGRGGGGAPGPVRKVPGPASKTLMKRNVGDSSETVSGTGTKWNIVSTPRSNSSAVPGAGSVPAPPRSNFTNNAAVNGVAPAPTKEKTFPEKVTTSCLLCLDPVIVELLRESGTLDTETLKQLVTNLCDHMKLDHKELPSEFTRIKFPFCDTCVEPVDEILECQKIIEDAKARIARATTTIERFVADAEIIHPNNHVQPHSMSSSAALMDQQRFSKLHDMILEVYRRKLIMKKILRKNLVVQVQPYEPNDNHMQDENLKNQSSSFEGFSKSNDLESTQPYSEDEDEEMAMDRMDTNVNIEESAENSDENESFQEDEDWQSDPGQNLSAPEDLALDPNAHYDEGYCALATSNVCGGSETSIVKQEPISLALNEDDYENENQDSVAVSTPPGAGIYKRRWYEGIEICQGTNPEGGDYLLCSSCHYTFPITKYYEKRIRSAYDRMKFHIITTHPQKKTQGPGTKQKKIVSVVERKTLSCYTCKKQFSDHTSLREHRKTHPLPRHECDICGRTIKGFKRNLMTHKFTHKNDEERRAAVAAEEIGAPPILLSNKHIGTLVGDKVQKYVTQPNKYKRKPKKQVAAVGSTTNKVAPAANFCCRFCPRKFIKKCYLSLHMKSHSSGNNSKPPKLQREKASYLPKQLPKNASNGREISNSDAASDGPAPKLTSFVVPPGASLDDIDIEENEMDGSSDESSNGCSQQ